MPVFDVIVVGARCAGSPTGMLLAKQGYRVLVADRAAFPSDTISTHFITPDGTARLRDWGLLERILATGVAPHHGILRTFQDSVLPANPDEPPCIAPRRTVLDTILAEAAREAGAEVRERTTIDGLIVEDGYVVGVRGRRSGEAFEERARVVVGADGRESLVARLAGAEEYNVGGGTTAGFYSYFRNFANNGPEWYLGGGAAHFLFPTNNSEVCVAVELTADRFKQFRGDVAENMAADLAAFPPLAERFAAAERTDKIFGIAPHRGFYRKPFGPGWALVGDAGYYRDPLLGQGINDAFRDAENLAGALHAVFAGENDWHTALSSYEEARNSATMNIYGLTNLLCEDLDPSMETLQILGGPAPSSAAG